eukprot:7634846-Ditylum_brightwellii.AAC.1
MSSNKSSAIESIAMLPANGQNATNREERSAAIIREVIRRPEAASNNGILQRVDSQGTVATEMLESMMSGVIESIA